MPSRGTIQPVVIPNKPAPSPFLTPRFRLVEATNGVGLPQPHCTAASTTEYPLRVAATVPAGRRRWSAGKPEKDAAKHSYMSIAVCTFVGVAGRINASYARREQEGNLDDYPAKLRRPGLSAQSTQIHRDLDIGSASENGRAHCSAS